MRSPLCIILEGTDGVGKTTIAHLLAAQYNACSLRCPGGTTEAELIRDMVKKPDNGLTSTEVTLLMSAADSMACREAERLLSLGHHVVMDRSMISNVVYRQAANVLDATAESMFNLRLADSLFFNSVDVLPGRHVKASVLVIHLRAAVSVCRRREQVRGEAADRFDRFLEQAAIAYDEFITRLAAVAPEYFKRADGSRQFYITTVCADPTVEEVLDTINARIAELREVGKI